MADEFATFVIGETTLNQIKALPPEMQLKFFWAVANYGVDGTEPDFTGVELAIWIPMRDLIRNSKRKNEKWLEKQRENGKKGGRPKTQNNSENPLKPIETQNNPNDIWDNSETHNGNENVNENGNGNGNGNGENQPPLLFIKNKTEACGFFLDDDDAIERLNAEIDSAWLYGTHTFINFIAETVRQEYGDKPKREQHRVFRKLLFDAPNLREEYPRWRQQQENIDGFRAAKEALAAARKNHPAECGNCGAKLRQWDGAWVCDSCHAQYSFNEGNREWDYHGPPPEGSLSEQYRQQNIRKHTGG